MVVIGVSVHGPSPRRCLVPPAKTSPRASRSIARPQTASCVTSTLTSLPCAALPARHIGHGMPWSWSNVFARRLLWPSQLHHHQYEDLHRLPSRATPWTRVRTCNSRSGMMPALPHWCHCRRTARQVALRFTHRGGIGVGRIPSYPTSTASSTALSKNLRNFANGATRCV